MELAKSGGAAMRERWTIPASGTRNNHRHCLSVGGKGERQVLAGCEGPVQLGFFWLSPCERCRPCHVGVVKMNSESSLALRHYYSFWPRKSNSMRAFNRVEAMCSGPSGLGKTGKFDTSHIIFREFRTLWILQPIMKCERRTKIKISRSVFYAVMEFDS
jgi:hypothetical protein